MSESLIRFRPHRLSILICLLSTHASWAARTPPAPPVTWETRVTESGQPIDLILEKAKKTRPDLNAKALKQASVALAAQKWLAARATVQKVVRDRVYGPLASRLIGQTHLGLALQRLKEKQWANAESAARYDYASSEDSGRANLIIGESRSKRKLHSTALDAFHDGFQKLLGAGRLSSVEVSAISSFAESCATTKRLFCRVWIQRLLALYPKDSAEFAALQGRFPEQALQLKSSWSGSKLTQAYKAPDPDQTAFDAAFDFILQRQYSRGTKDLQKFLDEFPRSQHRHRARFWLAQALSTHNDHERAQRLFEQVIRDAPLSFHALAAALALGVTPETAISATLPNAQSFDANLQPADYIRIERAEGLLAVGARDLAADELREFRAKDSLSNGFLYYLAVLAGQVGAHLTSFGALSELINRGADAAYSSHALPLVFPSPYYDLILKTAESFDLDPLLVLSLIKQESAFEAGIASSVGAQGLMQLMPATAADTEPGLERARLSEPETNIRVGAHYLKKMLSRFNGNVAFALAAYNAGPGAVDRWIRENRANRGLLEFIEQIPYRETRDYVGSIIRNYFWYSRTLAKEPLRDLDRFYLAQAIQPVPTPSTIPLLIPIPSLPNEPIPQPQAGPGGI